MKKLVPLVIALLGLGAGVGAGIALKPAPEPEATRPPARRRRAAPEHAEDAAAPPRPAPRDPFEPTRSPPRPTRPKLEGELAYVPLDKPFVVPVFAGEKVVAMVVVSLSVETDAEAAHDGRGGAAAAARQLPQGDVPPRQLRRLRRQLHRRPARWRT